MSETIVLSVCGWCELNPDEVLFCGPDDQTITGHEYLALDEDDREDYTLLSIAKAFDTSNMGEWTDVDLSVE